MQKPLINHHNPFKQPNTLNNMSENPELEQLAAFLVGKDRGSAWSELTPEQRVLVEETDVRIHVYTDKNFTIIKVGYRDDPNNHNDISAGSVRQLCPKLRLYMA